MFVLQFASFADQCIKKSNCNFSIIIINFIMNQAIENGQSNTELLRSYFTRKVGERDVLTCRLCKNDLKAPKGMT
jgi:hypothetical protein